MFKKNIFPILSGTLALLFTIYIALDTFVISHAYVTVPSSKSSISSVVSSSGTSATISNAALDESSSNTQSTSSSAPMLTENSYGDDNIQIAISSYRENNTDIYVADIVLSSPEYLKTALAKSTYGKNVVDTTSNIADDNNAILAINGDYYGVQESGYVIRSGVLYRSTSRGDQEDLAIYEDGSMAIINEQDITAEELLQSGVYNLLCFGPGLLDAGQITVSTNDEVDKAMASNPRTAIGMIDDLHYVFVVADGRTSESEGLSLYELAQFMQSLDVQTAYNLDGGGSSTMYFNGQLVNNPTSGSGHKSGHYGNTSSSGSERSVSDIVYIGY